MSSVSQHDLVLPERWALNKAGRAIGRTLKWEDPPTMGGTIPWHSSGAEAQTFTGCSFPVASSCYCQFWTKDCSLELGALGSSLLQAPLAQDFIPAAEVERETGSVNLSATFFKLQGKTGLSCLCCSGRRSRVPQGKGCFWIQSPLQRCRHSGGTLSQPTPPLASQAESP